MSPSILCNECHNEVPQPSERCPHCGRPGYFWNVIAAEDPAETSALERRYLAAKREAIGRGADKALQDFENVLSGSKAVITRSESEVLRLATSTRQLHATYYRMI